MWGSSSFGGEICQIPATIVTNQRILRLMEYTYTLVPKQHIQCSGDIGKYAEPDLKAAVENAREECTIYYYHKHRPHG